VRNNQLELRSRNSARLLATLGQLADALALPPGAERTLRPAEVKPAK
jgi:hypothetical protein